METAAPATIVQPGSILRGIGMRGDLNTKVLELLSDVHATIEPKDKRKRGRGAIASRWSLLSSRRAARGARADAATSSRTC